LLPVFILAELKLNQIKKEAGEMQYCDVFARILREVTGTPNDEISDLLNLFKMRFGEDHWERKITEEEGKAILQKLQSEKEIIRAWLERGPLEAVRRKDPDWYD
jgi:hypothetical protein